ncbi:carbonic anhydrase [Gymnopilus junonius]|uniref:Carbonic anhydrase n=1 Tax=Gymnopilus junonius TaxID=109634 RepID=A0A9P5NQJ6_GYMJU|nr:carbonic anhydrase [Gymnopilus junonius]
MSDTFIAHNDKYVASFDKGDLKLDVPNKKVVVVTCMDARIDPATQVGLGLGDAHILRNAGASAREALRSIIVSQRFLGVREVAIIHHTDCGLFSFELDNIEDRIKSEHPGNSGVAQAVDNVDFSALYLYKNLEDSVDGDVKWLKANPLLEEGTVVTGWVQDTTTGKVMVPIPHEPE